MKYAKKAKRRLAALVLAVTLTAGLLCNLLLGVGAEEDSSFVGSFDLQDIFSASDA